MELPGALGGVDSHDQGAGAGLLTPSSGSRVTHTQCGSGAAAKRAWCRSASASYSGPIFIHALVRLAGFFVTGAQYTYGSTS